MQHHPNEGLFQRIPIQINHRNFQVPKRRTSSRPIFTAPGASTAVVFLPIFGPMNFSAPVIRFYRSRHHSSMTEGNNSDSVKKKTKRSTYKLIPNLFPLKFRVFIGKKPSVKFWTLTTLESENCNPNRLTPRQQLAYIALKASKGVPVDQIIRNDADLNVNNEVKEEKRVATKCSNVATAIEKDEELPSDDQIIKELCELAADIDQENSVDSCLSEKELLHMAEGLETGNNSHMRPNLSSDLPVGELPFLTSDIAGFVKSTMDIQRLRSDILENERLARLTSELG